MSFVCFLLRPEVTATGRVILTDSGLAQGRLSDDTNMFALSLSDAKHNQVSFDRFPLLRDLTQNGTM